MRKAISNTARQPRVTGSGYVAYYRVSTMRRGESGLGLDAQRSAVARYLHGKQGLVAEFTEIESGKKHTNRPQLAAAIAEISTGNDRLAGSARMRSTR